MMGGTSGSTSTLASGATSETRPKIVASTGSTQICAARVAEDVDSADLSNVSGTPTFFVNGRRHYGAYDIAGLSTAVARARAREAIRVA